MKKVQVQLSVPRHIDGKLRRPEEGAIPVSADEAEAIEKAKAGEILSDEPPAKKKSAS